MTFAASEGDGNGKRLRIVDVDGSKEGRKSCPAVAASPLVDKSLSRNMPRAVVANRRASERC